jgi:hypothetical protein
MSDSKKTDKPATACADCTLDCPSGQCQRLEFYRALDEVRQAHAQACGTDYYDTKGEYAHTEHH